MKKQAGFTLIELVVVIVILGILAATALPKFMDVSKDARVAALRGLQGAVASAASMAFGKAAAAGADLSAASGATVSINGSSVSLVYGFPAAAAIDGLLQDRAGTTFATGVWTLRTNCTLTYAPPAAANGNPTYTLDDSGC